MTLATELVKRQNSASAREAMAMALAEVGRYDEALQWQRDAIATAERDRQANLAGALAANLRLFERRQPSRMPWRDPPPGNRSSSDIAQPCRVSSAANEVFAYNHNLC